MFSTPIAMFGSNSVAPTYLLDNNPNSQLAISFRRLSSSYNGNCVRVRRSSDNTEQNIGFSGGYIDTAALSAFCGAGNGYITIWYDQSGNGKNSVQATTSLQPQIVTSGVINTYNGKVYGAYDGTTFLQTSSNVTSLNFYSVHRYNATSGNGVPIGFGVSGNNANTYAFGILDNALYLVQNGTQDYANLTSIPSSFWGYNAWYGNYANMQVWRNNSQLALNVYGGDGSSTAPVEPVVTGKRGIGTGIIGFIQEQIVFNATSANTTITNNINSFYSIY